MVYAPSVQLSANFFRGCEPEVGNGNGASVVEAKDILRLQVPMVYPKGMAIFNSID